MEQVLWQEQILSYLPDPLQICLQRRLDANEQELDWREIRLRVGVHPSVVTDRGDVWLEDCPPVSDEEIRLTLHRMSHGSYYTLEQELQQAFLTLPGGHRVGLAGSMIFQEGQVQGLRRIASLNIRIARQNPGAASDILPLIVPGEEVLNTLIFSPPAAGKTTMIRDLARWLAEPRQGAPHPRLKRSFRVGIVDERSEIAGCHQGIPQLDIGRKSDVLDHCPKAAGIQLLLRSLNPEVIIADEVGRREDVEAIREALRCGVSIITTAHAGSRQQLLSRPWLRDLIQDGMFQRFVQLSPHPTPGQVEGVWDADGISLAPATWN